MHFNMQAFLTFNNTFWNMERNAALFTATSEPILVLVSERSNGGLLAAASDLEALDGRGQPRAELLGSEVAVRRGPRRGGRRVKGRE